MDLLNEDNLFKNVVFYVNFHYEKIMENEKMVEYVINSRRQINKLRYNMPEFNDRQLNSVYIGYTLLLLLMYSSMFG